jgi:hypothetical protein
VHCQPRITGGRGTSHSSCCNSLKQQFKRQLKEAAGKEAARAKALVFKQQLKEAAGKEAAGAKALVLTPIGPNAKSCDFPMASVVKMVV